MREDKKKKLIVIFSITILVLIIFFLCRGNSNMNGVNSQKKIRTDIDSILNMFPNIGEIRACKWEVEQLGSSENMNIPGPSNYIIRGIIELADEQLKAYSEDYQWEETDVVFKTLYIDKDSLKASTWLYSEPFEEIIKPMYLIGHIYLCKEKQILYFEVCK